MMSASPLRQESPFRSRLRVDVFSAVQVLEETDLRLLETHRINPGGNDERNLMGGESDGISKWRGK